MAEPPLDLAELPKCDGTNAHVLLAMLLMIAGLHAVTRAMSPLGFWGESYPIASMPAPDFMIGAAVFALAAYATMAKDANPDMLTRFLAPMLGLMAGFLLLDRNISSALHLSQAAGSVLSTVVELYAHTLYWVVHVTAIRYLTTHPYRLTGLAAAVMSFVAVFMALLLQAASSDQMDSTIAMVAIYAFAVFAAGLLKAMGHAEAQVRAEAMTERETPGRDEKWREIASRYGLTKRETDVFLLLAQGRDRSYIHAQLFISEATVRTHIEHIYAKLGIHSKQELISLVSQEAIE